MPATFMTLLYRATPACINVYVRLTAFYTPTAVAFTFPHMFYCSPELLYEAQLHYRQVSLRCVFSNT